MKAVAYNSYLRWESSRRSAPEGRLSHRGEQSSRPSRMQAPGLARRLSCLPSLPSSHQRPECILQTGICIMDEEMYTYAVITKSHKIFEGIRKAPKTETYWLLNWLTEKTEENSKVNKINSLKRFKNLSRTTNLKTAGCYEKKNYWKIWILKT